MKHFWQASKNDIKTYENTRKNAMGQRDDFTTARLLDHPYFNKNYSLIAIDLSKHETLSDKQPKEGITCDCLSAIMIDFVFKPSKTYFPQTLPEKRKYEIKQKELKSFVTRDLESFSGDEESSK